ncbi:iron uptake porin [Nostoc sp. DedQUE02]|uniref:iron uptake porin n=2 Tax=unclassified Nostoc TaxID=2593658 RepID=UPI002AD46F4F|nr:iron uptake porin [Nostoc sp. DedQUE03]MDZ7971140.1 iron uptake porin [Nostoc sp. DedQUE03]MDZ8045917.1 iron uptake porin [Nostoc sp. DedQUE02]
MNYYQLMFVKKARWLCLLTAFISLAASPATAKPIAGATVNNFEIAENDNRGVSLTNSNSLESNAIAQVNSVSQLSDVKTTDWAFLALQSVVERYGCIVGYPDSTYKGNRALSRYEFAAGLNACLDRINELIATSTADLVSKDDLAILQKLQEQFGAELATLRGRVDALEPRIATLEKQQFSTTTKLNGEAIFSLSTATGGEPGSQDAKLAFNNRVRLNLTSSFNGTDLLIVGLQAYNFRSTGSFYDRGTIQGQLLPNSSLLGAGSTKLSFEPQFPGFNPQTLQPDGGANSVSLYKLAYVLPLSQKFVVFAGTNAEITDVFPAITPYASDSQGAISRFAGYNAAVRITGGTSGTGLLAGAGFLWNPSKQVGLGVIYGSGSASLPEDRGLLNTALGGGFFNGTQAIAAQLTLKPISSVDIGINYAHSYHTINILGTGLGSADIASIRFTPNAAQLGNVGGNATLAILDEPINVNSVGATVTWRFAPKTSFSLSGALLFAHLLNVDASTTFSSWSAGLHFRDIFHEGNSAAVIFGQPLYRQSVAGIASRLEDATPYHLETFYNYRVNDNISITPGVYFIFNPEGFSANETAIVGALRTTFTF